MRPDDPGDVDRLVDDLTRGGGGQEDASAVGGDLAFVFDERFQGRAVRRGQGLDDLVSGGELDEAVPVQIEGEAFASAQRHASQIGEDDAGIPDMGRDQRGDARLADRDPSFIDH